MKKLTIEAVKSYVAHRTADLIDQQVAAVDPNRRFEVTSALDELYRFSAWIEVHELTDTDADRTGIEL